MDGKATRRLGEPVGYAAPLPRLRSALLVRFEPEVLMEGAKIEGATCCQIAGLTRARSRSLTVETAPCSAQTTAEVCRAEVHNMDEGQHEGHCCVYVCAGGLGSRVVVAYRCELLAAQSWRLIAHPTAHPTAEPTPQLSHYSSSLLAPRSSGSRPGSRPGVAHLGVPVTKSRTVRGWVLCLPFAVRCLLLLLTVHPRLTTDGSRLTAHSLARA